MVMGPTPPGTGVIALATFETSSKSTSPTKPESVLLVVIKGTPFKRQLIRWIKYWRKLKSPVTGLDLIKLGWKPGPSIGNELKRQRNLIIDQGHNR